MKKMIQISLVVIAGVFTIIFAYDVFTPDFKMYEYDNHMNLVIDNETYKTNNGALHSDIKGKRIGFVESKLSFLNIFLTPLPHGVYEIEDSSGERFYSVYSIFMDRQYSLFVKDDFDTDFLSKADCSRVVIEGYEGVADPEVIEELIFYLKKEAAYVDDILPVDAYNVRLYSKEFPSIYYLTQIYKSEADGSVWLSDFKWAGGVHVKIPNELFDKLTATPLAE